MADDSAKRESPLSEPRSEEPAPKVGRFAVGDKLEPWLNAMPNGVLVLDKDQEIVFCNDAMARIAGLAGDAATGLRKGELLGCRAAIAAGATCGHTRFCKACGGLKAILNSNAEGSDVQEFRVARERASDSLDLHVTVTTVNSAGEAFTVFAVRDISHQKRRFQLERVFFHDVLNTSVSLRGCAAMLKMADDMDEAIELADSVYQLADKLVDDVGFQKRLVRAEDDNLEVRSVPLQSLQVLGAQVALFEDRETGMGCRVVIAPAAEDVAFESDEAILRRVLANLVKNAGEASEDDQVVTLSCMREGKDVCFTVHNVAAMPENVQLQVFHRSFSTKGEDRGLGTYSARLLMETCLNGAVSFTSTPTAGTTFTVRCPLSPPKDESA